jgi:hypothetical protein
MSRSCSTNVGHEKCIQTLVLKPEGKTSLGRRRHRWWVNIKVVL